MPTEFYELTYLEFKVEEGNIKCNTHRLFELSSCIKKRIFNKIHISKSTALYRNFSNLEDMKKFGLGKEIGFEIKDEADCVKLSDENWYKARCFTSSDNRTMEEENDDDTFVFIREHPPILLDIRKVS